MNKLGNLSYGGINSLYYQIYLVDSDDANIPERDYTAFSIPGRSRDLHYDNGRWQNIDRTYTLYARSSDGISAEMWMTSYVSALMNLSGYQRICDTMHPEYYKKGEFRGGVSPKFSPYKEGVLFDLAFDCDARKYLVAGEEPVDISNTGSSTWQSYVLAGQGTVPAKPILLFSGFTSANCAVTLGDKTITVDSYSGTLVYDCELGDAYDQSSHANLNSYITLSSGDLPDLTPGLNSFLVKQGAMVRIIPNWCKL